MKKWIGIGGLLLLAGCGEQGLTIEPAQLEEEGQQIITMSAMEFMQVYEVNGPVPEDKTLILEVERYENGERLESLLSISEVREPEYKDASFAFGKSMLAEGAETFVVGLPDGKAEAVNEALERTNQALASGDLIHEKIRIEEDEPVYVGFYASKAGDGEMRAGGYAEANGKLNLEAVAEMDEFYALKLMLTEERVQ